MSEAGRALAAELRALIAHLHEVEVSDGELREARRAIAALRARLEGAPRPRWFEREVVDGRGSRVARQRFADHSLFRGAANPLAVPMVTDLVTLDDGRPAIEGRVAVPRPYEGPPHGVHGGYLAGLFDDVLGATQSLVEGPSGLTGTLSVRYRSITPLETELVLRAWVEHERGRRILSRATCHAGDELTAQADALFVRVDMAALAERRPPERRPPER